MGVSCDGYVSCECCGEGVIEVKCPFKWGKQPPDSLQQWLADKKGHLESLTALKNDHAYFTQASNNVYNCTPISHVQIILLLVVVIVAIIHFSAVTV